MKSKNILSIKFIVLLSFFSLLLFGEGRAKTIINGIVAVVNEDIITYRDLESSLKPYIPYIKEKYRTEKDREKAFLLLKQKTIEKLINNQLIVQRAKLLGIEASSEQIDSAIEDIKKNNSLDEKQFEANLIKEGLSLEMLRKKIQEQILYSRIANYRIKSKVVITEKDIENYYRDNIEKFGGTKMYHLRNIVIKTPKFMDDYQQAEVTLKITDVEKKLKMGIPFENVARTFSEISNKDKGGDLGFIKKEDIAKNIREEIEKTGIGNYTKTLEIQNSYQIFYIEGIKEGRAEPLENVRDEIEKKLYEKALDTKFQEWLKELRETAYIKVMDKDD